MASAVVQAEVLPDSAPVKSRPNSDITSSRPPADRNTCPEDLAHLLDEAIADTHFEQGPNHYNHGIHEVIERWMLGQPAGQ